MKMHIKEFANLTGVSVRTLHYYDEIGLLKPAFIDHNNNYRFYSEASLERMQEILFYRELDFPLKRIITILSSPDYDKKKALSEQKRLLILKKERLERLILAFANADAITSDNSKFENKMEIQEEPKMNKDETMYYKAFTMLLKTANELPITGKRHGIIINKVATLIVDIVGNTNSPCQENSFAALLFREELIAPLLSRCLKSIDSPHTSEDKIKNIVMDNLINHICLCILEKKGYNALDKCFRSAFSSENTISITTAKLFSMAEDIKNYCEEYYKNCPNEVSKDFFETEFYKNTESYVENIIKEISPYQEYYSKIFDDYKNEPTFIYDKEFDSLCSKLYHSDMTQHERNIIEAIRDVYIYELKILSAMDFCEKLRYSKNLEYIPTEEAAFDWLEQVINSGRRLAKIDEIEKAVNRPNPCEECIKMMEDDLENDTDDHPSLPLAKNFFKNQAKKIRNLLDFFQ